jgi:hypothetical protein
MKFKIDSGIVAAITAVTLFILIMGYFMPVRSWFEKPQPRKNMVFRCEMVDGKVRDYTLNLPENVTWYVGTSRGSYYVNFGSPTKNLYGKECPIDNNEGCINGVLVCNRIK